MNSTCHKPKPLLDSGRNPLALASLRLTRAQGGNSTALSLYHVLRGNAESPEWPTNAIQSFLYTPSGKMFSDRATTPNDLLRQLLSRMAQGDRTAFDSFYREMEKPVFRFIKTKLNDPFTCADLLHDVFLDVWRAAPGFDGRSSVKTWVFSIAYRKVVDFMRKNSRFADEDSIPEQEDDGPAAVECIWKAQEADMLRACLETLKPDHRLAIEMTFYSDMSYKEIAEVTSVPEGTVKTRVFHAKNLLLRCLQQRMRARVRE